MAAKTYGKTALTLSDLSSSIHSTAEVIVDFEKRQSNGALDDLRDKIAARTKQKIRYKRQSDDKKVKFFVEI